MHGVQPLRYHAKIQQDLSRTRTWLWSQLDSVGFSQLVFSYRFRPFSIAPPFGFKHVLQLCLPHDEWNSHSNNLLSISEIKLPECVRHLTFGQHFNQSLDWFSLSFTFRKNGALKRYFNGTWSFKNKNPRSKHRKFHQTCQIILNTIGWRDVDFGLVWSGGCDFFCWMISLAFGKSTFGKSLIHLVGTSRFIPLIRLICSLNNNVVCIYIYIYIYKYIYI